MKYTGLILITLFLFACNHKSEQSAVQKSANIDINMLASKKDYVCGMTLDKESVGDTAQYEGKIYGFCSSECKNEFLKDPQSHLPKN